MIDNLRPLTQEQRQTARQSARQAVVRSVGPRPAREQFAHHTVSKYPSFVTRLISLLCIILLLAAFTPSAIRLYVIGSQTFGQAVPNQTARNVVGLATVLSAEIGQVMFSLALATLGTSQSARRLLYFSMSLCTITALTGNIQVALPGYTNSPFAWLEAIVPPLLVLSTAYVLKEQLLDSIEHRHATERTYQAALNEWHKGATHPENHPQWAQFHANALRDALHKANNRRQETVAALTTADWRRLVYRELQAELWYVKPEDNSDSGQGGEVEMTLIPLAPHVRRNGNSIHTE